MSDSEAAKVIRFLEAHGVMSDDISLHQDIRGKVTVEAVETYTLGGETHSQTAKLTSLAMAREWMGY